MTATGRSEWTSLYVFGDSFSDTGAGYLDGDGPTAVAYLAERWGVPFTHANDPRADPETGLNFAVSGGATGVDDGVAVKDALLGRGMLTQIADFRTRLDAGRVRFDPDRTLFFLAGGLNDSTLSIDESRRNVADQVAALVGCGATRFRVAYIPEFSLSDHRPRFNAMIGDLVIELSARLPGVSVRTSDWGRYFDQIKREPALHGFVNATDRCAGRALFDEDPTPVADPGTYFFYHAGHPSTAVHRLVGQSLEAELRWTLSGDRR